jgi:hypothetical protein
MLACVVFRKSLVSFHMWVVLQCIYYMWVVLQCIYYVG